MNPFFDRFFHAHVCTWRYMHHKYETRCTVHVGLVCSVWSVSLELSSIERSSTADSHKLLPKSSVPFRVVWSVDQTVLSDHSLSKLAPFDWYPWPNDIGTIINQFLRMQIYSSPLPSHKSTWSPLSDPNAGFNAVWWSMEARQNDIQLSCPETGNCADWQCFSCFVNFPRRIIGALTPAWLCLNSLKPHSGSNFSLNQGNTIYSTHKWCSQSGTTGSVYHL